MAASARPSVAPPISAFQVAGIASTRRPSEASTQAAAHARRAAPESGSNPKVSRVFDTRSKGASLTATVCPPWPRTRRAVPRRQGSPAVATATRRWGTKTAATARPSSR
jgi:hypothetical protein